MRIRFLLLAGLLLTAGCDTASDPLLATDPVEVAFEPVEGASGFARLQPGTDVIREDTAWLALWEQTWNVFDGSGTPTAPPANDFSHYMVIAVFWGDGFSGCENIVSAIESIRMDDGQIIVRIGPLPDLGPCDALVYPVQMVRVEQSNLDVVFEGQVPD